MTVSCQSPRHTSELVERCLMRLDEIWAKEPIPFDDREEMVRAVITRMRELPDEPGPRYERGDYSRNTQRAMVEDALR
jgi:hypothetical protein